MANRTSARAKARESASQGAPAQTPLLLAGQPRSTPESLTIRAPWDGHPIASVSQAGPAEAEAALAAAAEAFSVTRRLTSGERARICQAIAGRIAADREDIARGIVLEAGKPIQDALRETDRAIDTFSIAAAEASRITGAVLPLDTLADAPGNGAQRTALARRFPLGPILGITPFNFPLNLVAHKLAPAIAAGNPIVLKPAPQTPLTALRLGQLAVECGWPAAAISVLPCGNQVASLLLADPRPRLLSFTGSAAVGWDLKARAGQKRVVLELGGNAALIVHDDADLNLAAAKIAAGAFAYAGQSCISVQRIFVHKARWQTLAQKITVAAEDLIAGDPLDPDTELGPMISEAAAERAEAWIREAVDGGAHLLTGGARNGATLEATVVAKPPAAARLVTEEAFAPIVTIAPYDTFEEALALVNHSRYGLQASVFTRDFERIAQAWRELEVGAVLVNESTSWRADQMPYGGVKASGIGREGLHSAILEMTEERLLIADM